eukprot:EC123436.1.p1 GENE.EC123436.1~~EC123436.1.p1  ORF type:complete len:194 (+),score=26.44 EC123436.1:62-643(+)
MAIPIPKNAFGGILFGSVTAPVHLDVYIDFQCPFCKKAWPTVEQLAQTYTRDQLRFVFYPTILAGHRQAWEAAMAARVVAGEDGEKFFNFASLLYNRQSEFNNESFRQKTYEDLLNLFASFAEGFNGSNKSEFLAKVQSNEVYSDSKTPVRLAIVRGVWSTPTFAINGAMVPKLGSSSTIDDWKAVIDPLLPK